MRIAIDVTASIYEGSGVATYYKNLIPRLLNIGTQHQFLLFGYSLRRRQDLKLANIILPLPPKLMELIWNKWHLFPVESFIGACDLVHSWDFIQPPTKKARIVTTIHDLTPLIYPSHQHPRTVKAYKQGLKWVKKNSAMIIADSLSTKKDIMEILKIPERKIQVIYLGVSDIYHDFRSKMNQDGGSMIKRVKEKYEIKRDYLLFVGTQEPRKNLKKVVEAYDAFSSDFDMVIAGNIGWGRKTPQVSGVKLIGYVSEKDLPALYAGASCFIYPSLYEGFGLPVLEAMAVGCPVVTSDRGSLSEVAGDAAVLVNPEKTDAIAFGIESAINNSKILKDKGIKQAQKFSWDQTAQQTLAVYELFLEKTQRLQKLKPQDN